MKTKVSGWQKAIWIAILLGAGVSVGLIPKLTDVQTVQAAEKEHQDIRRDFNEKHQEIKDLLNTILEKL